MSEECLAAASKLIGMQTARAAKALDKLYVSINSMCANPGEIPEKYVNEFKTYKEVLEEWMKHIHKYSECYQTPSSAGIAMGATVGAYTTVVGVLELVGGCIMEINRALADCKNSSSDVYTMALLKATYEEVKCVVVEACTVTKLLIDLAF